MALRCTLWIHIRNHLYLNFHPILICLRFNSNIYPSFYLSFDSESLMVPMDCDTYGTHFTLCVLCISTHIIIYTKFFFLTYRQCILTFSGCFVQKVKILKLKWIYIVYCCSVIQLCLTLCDPMDCSMPGSLSSISQSFLKLMCIELMKPFNLPLYVAWSPLISFIKLIIIECIM